MCKVKEKNKEQKKPPKTPKQQLDDKLWITRKSRINASERLLKTANFINFINVYYSIFLILLSLISISPFADKSGLLSYVSLAGSITLTISIIYASSLGYKRRSTALKQNYIALQGLMDRLKFTNDTDKEGIQVIQQEYNDLLNNVENHKNIDYLDLLRTRTVEDKSMTIGNWCYYLGYYLWNFIWKAVLVIAPVAYIVYLFV